MSSNINGSTIFSNWNNMYNANNMNMNNFINSNMGMNSINNPMAAQMNLMLQNFYNQMAQLQAMNFNNQVRMMNYNVNNNANNVKRTDRLPTYNENIPNDPFPGYPGERANLIFQTSKGYKITLIAPLVVQFHQVLVEYIKKVGLGPNALYDGFVFLYNGAKIDIKDKVKLVRDLAYIGNVKQNHIVIVVVDTKNLIGS